MTKGFARIVEKNFERSLSLPPGSSEDPFKILIFKDL